MRRPDNVSKSRWNYLKKTNELLIKIAKQGKWLQLFMDEFKMQFADNHYLGDFQRRVIFGPMRFRSVRGCLFQVCNLRRWSIASTVKYNRVSIYKGAYPFTRFRLECRRLLSELLKLGAILDKGDLDEVMEGLSDEIRDIVKKISFNLEIGINPSTNKVIPTNKIARTAFKPVSGLPSPGENEHAAVLSSAQQYKVNEQIRQVQEMALSIYLRLYKRMPSQTKIRKKNLKMPESQPLKAILAGVVHMRHLDGYKPKFRKPANEVSSYDYARACFKSLRRAAKAVEMLNGQNDKQAKHAIRMLSCYTDRLREKLAAVSRVR